MASKLPRIVPASLSGPISNQIIPSPKVLRAVHNQQVSNGISLTAAKAGDPEWWAFGRCLAEGQIVSGDDSTGELVIDIQWSRGEIQEFEHRIFAGVREGLGTALGENEHFVGTSGQLASTILTNILGSYDALPNRAHSVLTLNPNFQPKTLDIRMLGKWLKVVDPRNSPAIEVYTTNPALILARILLDSGYTLDYSSVAACADYCDELVSGSSPSFKRWEIGGQIKNRRQLREWLETMSAYANCFIDIQGGTASLVPDTPRAANHTVTAADMLERSVRRRGPGKSDVPSAVTVIFEHLYVQAEEEGSGDKVGTVSGSITFGTSQGAGSVTTLDMKFFQDYQRAGRKAEEAFYRAGNMLELEFTGFDSFLARTVGDVGTITNGVYGLTAQAMTLIENTSIERGRWRARYVKYSTDNYSDNYYDGSYNFSNLQNPDDPPDGPCPNVTEELHTNEDGVTYARLKIVFTGVSWAYIQNYRLTVIGDDAESTVILNSDAEHLGAGQVHTIYTVTPLTNGVTYTVSVAVRSTTGAVGDPCEVEITSSQATNILADSGDLTNMHRYVLDGDAAYCTTSQKTAQLGETWASRFGSESPQGQAWNAGEIWLSNQVTVTVFQTETWDSGNLWSGLWRFNALNFTGLSGASIGPFVALADPGSSPVSFVENTGWTFSDEAQYMQARAQVSSSPISPGMGLHVKLPVRLSFDLGQ